MSSGSTHRVFKMFNRRLVDMLRCSSLSYANCRALRRRQRRAPESPNPKHRTPENHQSPKKLQYRKHRGKMRTDWNLEFEVSLEFGAWGLVLPAKAGRSLGIGFGAFAAGGYPTKLSFSLRVFTMIRTNSAGSLGLAKCRSNPAFNARSRSWRLP